MARAQYRTGDARFNKGFQDYHQRTERERTAAEFAAFVEATRQAMSREQAEAEFAAAREAFDAAPNDTATQARMAQAGKCMRAFNA